jgi:hypothetical protein
VADCRIHGTTKQQVGKLFAEVERRELLPLPAEDNVVVRAHKRKKRF